MELPQVKSKQRVADHGEVYTNPREVNAMLNLVKEQSFSLGATFLEPACGNGNFLIEILRRKLCTLAEQYRNDPLAYDTHLLQVVSSIYGIDILPDNIAECHDRLFTEISTTYTQVHSRPLPLSLAKSLVFVMQKNILCGDATEYETIHKEPIIFYKWIFKSSNNNEVLDEVMYETSVFERTALKTGDKKTQIAMDFDRDINAEPPITDYHGKPSPYYHYLSLSILKPII
jgi:type III restriction system methylase